MQKKSKVLVFVDYYLPGYLSGGPVRTISNMVDLLGDKVDFHIIAQDHDLGSEQVYPDIQKDQWMQVGKARVKYWSASDYSFASLLRVIREEPWDQIYLNSFFSPLSSLKIILLHRIYHFNNLLLAPRGEFSPGALQLKATKKQTYLKVARLLGLCQNITWHASTLDEKKDITSLFGDQPIKVAIDVPTAYGQPISAGPELFSDEVRLIFISRISRKKNLIYALKILKQVQVPVVFDVFGPIEDRAYWQECQQVIEALPSHVRVNYCGTIENQQVVAKFSAYNILLFPTLGENFGHVISEALLGGCMLLISDQTPWHGLEAAGVGWDLPLSTPSAFVEKIHTYAQWSTETKMEHRQQCFDYMKVLAASSSVLQDNLALFTKKVN